MPDITKKYKLRQDVFIVHHKRNSVLFELYEGKITKSARDVCIGREGTYYRVKSKELVYQDAILCPPPFEYYHEEDFNPEDVIIAIVGMNNDEYYIFSDKYKAVEYIQKFQKCLKTALTKKIMVLKKHLQLLKREIAESNKR